mgnify:FL=1|jgi:hypothetical protein
MATIKQVVGAPASLAYNSTDLSTLATLTYVRNTTAFDCSTNQPVDVVVEGNFATGTSSGNKQVVLFLQESLDGTNYRSGPTSGSTATREPNLLFLGSVPLTTASTTETGTFSVLQALGYIPKKFYVVVKNDNGAALNVGTVNVSEISSTVA